MYKILIPPDISETGIAFLRDRGYKIKMCSQINEKQLIADLIDCDGMMARGFAISKAIAESAPKLRVIAKLGVGFDKIDLDAMTKHGIQVVNTPKANTISVAEHTILLLLGISRNILVCDEKCRTGKFEQRYSIPSFEIAQKTLGLIGFGNIAKEVALKAHFGFQMKVLGYHYNRNIIHNTPARITDDLDEILSESDYISIHLPLNNKTRHMIGIEQLLKMKKTAYLINTSRGAIIDENALIEALQKGYIAGAALDAYEDEPPNISNPLFNMKNVLCTPHNAALTKEARDRMSIHAAQGIDEVLSGRKPTWPVNII